MPRDPLRIIWSDAHVVCALKPSGLPVQADQTGDADMLSLLREQLAEPDLLLVHRLDRPVSGVVLFAKTPASAANLSEQFSGRLVQKIYWAIVTGVVDAEAVLEANIVHDGRAHKARASTDVEASKARLRIKPLARGERYTLLEVEPDGGAFHQIRVQLSTAGHAIKGDVKYGARRGEKDRSIALHARSIAFVHPQSSERITVEAEVPPTATWIAFKALLPR